MTCILRCRLQRLGCRNVIGLRFSVAGPFVNSVNGAIKTDTISSLDRSRLLGGALGKCSASSHVDRCPLIDRKAVGVRQKQAISLARPSGE